jgi:hypothetical protein
MTLRTGWTYSLSMSSQGVMASWLDSRIQRASKPLGLSRVRDLAPRLAMRAAAQPTQINYHRD